MLTKDKLYKDTKDKILKVQKTKSQENNSSGFIFLRIYDKIWENKIVIFCLNKNINSQKIHKN